MFKDFSFGSKNLFPSKLFILSWIFNDIYGSQLLRLSEGRWYTLLDTVPVPRHPMKVVEYLNVVLYCDSIRQHFGKLSPFYLIWLIVLRITRLRITRGRKRCPSLVFPLRLLHTPTFIDNYSANIGERNTQTITHSCVVRQISENGTYVLFSKLPFFGWYNFNNSLVDYGWNFSSAITTFFFFSHFLFE